MKMVQEDRLPGSWIEIPSTFHRTSRRKFAIQRIRIASGHPDMLVGVDSRGVIHPLDVSWLDTAVYGVGEIPLENWVKEKIKAGLESGAHHEWVPIPTGSRKRRKGPEGGQEKQHKRGHHGPARGDAAVALVLAKPKRRLTVLQREGTNCCYPAAAAVGIGMFAEDRRNEGLSISAKYIMSEGAKVEEGAGDKKNRAVTRLLLRTLQVWGYCVRNMTAEQVEAAAGSTMCEPIIVRLRSRGEYPHCVAFYKDMILDPTEPCALSRTRENLDMICGGKGCYLGIGWAKKLQLDFNIRELAMTQIGPSPIREIPKGWWDTSKLVAAVCSALNAHGLILASSQVRSAAEKADFLSQGGPRRWLERLLLNGISKIECCQYKTIKIQSAACDDKLELHHAVVAKINSRAGEYVAISEGRLVSHVWMEDLRNIKDQLGWAIAITR